MEQAFLRVELLLAGGPHKSIPALAADQVFVGQRYRHSRAPPAESYAGQSSVASASGGGGAAAPPPPPPPPPPAPRGRGSEPKSPPAPPFVPPRGKAGV